MEQMCEELIRKIEKALDIEFYGWQRQYLLDEPIMLDMRITGRCTGKTLVFIVKKLFEDSEPLLIRSKKETLNVADWWCCENSIDRAFGHPYIEWYRYKLIEIYEKLTDAGVMTRKVIFR